MLFLIEPIFQLNFGPCKGDKKFQSEVVMILFESLKVYLNVLYFKKFLPYSVLKIPPLRLAIGIDVLLIFIDFCFVFCSLFVFFVLFFFNFFFQW